MKICSQCKELKDLSEYFRNKNTKDGRHSSCKECQNKNKKYDSNKRREYYLLNKDRDREKNKKRRREYYILNKEKENTMSKKYKEKNRVEVNSKSKEYYHSIKNTKEYKESKNKYYKNRLVNDPLYKTIHYLRCMLNTYFKRGGFNKSTKTFEILGCSYEEFKIYLESKFEPWMTWENRGMYNGEFNYGWDIDHIIPISSAKTEDDIIKLNHYTNLQPLCSKINRDIKKNSLL